MLKSGSFKIFYLFERVFMPINNVINTNKISELLKGTPVRRARIAQVPSYLSKTGSIFNAPGVAQSNNISPTPERVNIAELNQRQSLKDLEENKKPKSNGDSSGAGKFEGIHNVAGGKAAVAEGKSIQGNVKTYTRQTENDIKTIKQSDSGAQKLEEKIVKEDKAFAARFKTDQQEFKKDNDKLLKLVKEQEEIQKQVDNAQHEIETLTTSTGNSNKQGRISELQTFIGAKVGLMQNNGKIVYSLQRSQSRTLKRLNKSQRQYIQINNKNQKNMKAEEAKTNKIINIATKIEQYSAMAQSAGQAINLAGIALVALGSATSWCGVGGALVAIGTVMQKVGKVVELVGQYGQCAAGLTKSAAYAAEGNIMGAMMSAAAAMQTGAAAVSGTKGLKGEFGRINDQANAAKQNIAAKAQAKEIVNNMDQKELKEMGLSKKDARKYITNDLKAQMADDENISNKMGNLRHYAENTKVGNTDQTVKDKMIQDAKSNWNTAKTETIQNKYSNYTEQDDGSWTLGDKKVSKKKFNKEVSKAYRNEMPKTENKTGMNFAQGIQALGKSATNIAGVFMQNSAIEQMSRRSGRTLQPYQMDARTRMIMERNQRYRRHAAGYV